MEKKADTPIFIMHFDIDKKVATQLTMEEFQSKNISPDSSDFFWIDIKSEEISHLNMLLANLSAQFDFENYFGRTEILPHLKENPYTISFYLYDVINADSHSDSGKDITNIEHEPFLVLLSRKFVITYHKMPLEVIEKVKKDCGENFKLAGKTAAFVVFLLIQHCMYNYARMNLANDNFLDLIEADVLTKKESDFMSNIAVAGYNILMFKKMNANLHIILLVLATKRNYIVMEEARLAFNHMLKDSLGIRDGIDSSRDLLDSIINGIQAEASRKTSQIIHFLTMVSTIFMPLTLISGIYGMNFAYLPELHWTYGYFFALGLMVTIASGFLYSFKRKGWW